MVTESVLSLFRRTPFFRGKGRIASAITPRRGTVSGRLYGAHMRFDLSDLIQRAMYAGIYDPHESAELRSVLRPGDTFVDAGANVGYYSALAASLVGKTGRVLSFEPTPAIFARLEEWVRLSGAQQVEPFQLALGDSEGSLTLYIPPSTYGNADPSRVRYTEGMTPISVPVRRLSDVCREHSLGSIDVLKVDVEGHEPELFEGCKAMLVSGAVRWILCEFNDPLLRARGYSATELLQFLGGCGYMTANAAFPMDGRVINLLLRRRETARQ